jgi:hypothetical protein
MDQQTEQAPALSVSKFKSAIDGKFDVNARTGCWEWTRARRQNGYGVVQIAGRQWKAHRASYVAHYEVDPGALFVLHQCDNPACINPAHLVLGSHADNMRDKFAKGRHDQRGRKNPRNKLSDEAVHSIRGDSRTLAEIAKTHGVSLALVGLIKQRKRWAHI